MDKRLSRVAHCRHKATEYDKQAEAAKDLSAKQMFRDLTKQWRELAKQLERPRQ